jgi:hypothetical protein
MSMPEPARDQGGWWEPIAVLIGERITEWWFLIHGTPLSLGRRIDLANVALVCLGVDPDALAWNHGRPEDCSPVIDLTAERERRQNAEHRRDVAIDDREQAEAKVERAYAAADAMGWNLDAAIDALTDPAPEEEYDGS